MLRDFFHVGEGDGSVLLNDPSGLVFLGWFNGLHDETDVVKQDLLLLNVHADDRAFFSFMHSRDHLCGVSFVDVGFNFAHRGIKVKSYKITEPPVRGRRFS